MLTKVQKRGGGLTDELVLAIHAGNRKRDYETTVLVENFINHCHKCPGNTYNHTINRGVTLMSSVIESPNFPMHLKVDVMISLGKCNQCSTLPSALVDSRAGEN